MNKIRAGFSLLEVMLVLLLTFVLFTVMISMVQASINRERYKDTVVSLKDFFQRQYNEVQNVVLDAGVATVNPSCDSSVTRGSNRGRTECFVIGRLLNFYVEDNASVIKVEQVVYRADDTTGSDNLIFNDFNLKDTDNIAGVFGTYGFEIEKYPVEWAARLYSPGSPLTEINQNASIFIFRSPETGAIRTHILPNSSTNSSSLGYILASDTLKNDLKICVVPGAGFAPKKLAVRIAGGSANSSGVEIAPHGSDAAKGEVNCD